MIVWQNRMFHRCLVGRPYPPNTRENQLSPSCLDSSHSSHVQGICITSWDAKSQATYENISVFNAFSLHTHSLSYTTLTNKSHMKYMVQKIEHNYNQTWHEIKANKTHSCKLQLYNLPLWLFRDKPLKQTLDLNVSLGTMAKLTHS